MEVRGGGADYYARYATVEVIARESESNLGVMA